MKHCSQIFVCMVMMCWSISAWAEIDQAVLTGEWCLVSQTLNGHDLAVISPNGTLSKKLKAKPGQQYHFKDQKTVDVMMVDKTNQTFAYSFKKSAISVRKWEWFKVKSITDSEINATVYGTVKHRFTRGKCE